MFSFERMLKIWEKYGPMYLSGLGNTLLFSVVAVFVGLVLGLVLASGRMLTLSPRDNAVVKVLKTIAKLLCTAYVEVFRATPMLVQVFIIYYGLGNVFKLPDASINRMFWGMVAVGLNSAAYMSEVIRSGIGAVPGGQMEAARCVGMSHWKAMQHVVLPQAVRNILPAMCNEFVTIIKAVSYTHLDVYKRQVVDDKPHGEAQEAVQLAHPLAVAAGQVIVHRHHVHAFARQGVEVHGQGGHQGFALAGFHLGDTGAVQYDAAHHLHGKVLHAQHAPGGLAAHGEGVGQDIVQAFAGGQAAFQLVRLGLQFFIGHGLVGGLQSQHLVGDGLDLFQFLGGKRAEQFFKKCHLCYTSLPRAGAAL